MGSGGSRAGARAEPSRIGETVSYKVMKFGGSSVGESDSLFQVIQLIAAQVERGPVAVVVSAMGGTTDSLLEAIDAAEAGSLEAAVEILGRSATIARDTSVEVAGRLGGSVRRG